MPLSNDLDDVVLDFACPHCGHQIHKMGSWFKTRARFICSSCGVQVRLPYTDKLRLFGKNAHRAKERHTAQPSDDVE